MNKDFTTPPLKQLFEQTPGTRERSTQAHYERFVEEGGTVFEMLKMGRQGVVEAFGLHSRSAQALLEKALSLAVYTAREFREQRLVRSGPANPLHRTGIRSEIKTPTFDDLFDPDWEAASPSQSPDSSISPAAYFLRLVILARDLEARASGGTGLITFDTRRPDLLKLVIDTTSMFQIKPTVTLVNEVLESIIKTHLAGVLQQGEVVDDKLLETRYPHRSMPFEWYAEQYKLVLGKNKLALGELVRAIDLSAPYFKQPSARGDLSDISLHQSCNVGPQGQRLLTEDFTGPTNGAKFFKDNFGSTEEELLDSVHFCAQTSIDAKSLTSLLSIEDFAPTRSANAPLVMEATPKIFGSAFINYGGTAAMDLSAPVRDATRKFVNSSLNRFDRMNRMLRLSRWLNLPVDQCDRLVMAAFYAELRGEIHGAENRKRELETRASMITNNTLRAIGLFEEFRLRFKCTAEQFAALIDEISPYGRGEQASQFDRIFNDKALFDTPLILDEGFFAIEPQTRADKRSVDQICSSLGINQETWRYLARFVAKSFNLRDELQRSLPVLTAFYRLVLLSSFLRITPIELTALLETLSGRGASEVLQRVLGEAKLLVSGTSGIGDVLSVMHAAQTCVQWTQENDVSVPWLVSHVAPVITPPMATAADVALLQEIHTRLQPVRLTEEMLRAAGVPQSDEGNSPNWLKLLQELVDTDGLVSSLANEEDDYDRAVAEIHAAVLKANVLPADVERVRTVLLALVLQARDAQCAVVQESLSVYLSLSQDLILPLLKWVDSGGVYLLLMETTRALDAVTSGVDKVNVGDDVLNLLAHLTRRADVIRKLSLSSAMLVALTTQQNWQWFGLKRAEELTLNTLYQLTIFQRAVTHAGQPAEKLLHYLELVNGLPANLTPEDMRLIRDSAATKLADVLKWGVREVLECILHLAPSKPIVRDITTLDTLLRIRALATRSGLDAKAIIRLGVLTPESNKHAWRGAAEHVLESLSESTMQGQTQEIGEIGQSVTHEVRCVNDTLIANVNGEVALVELTLRDLANKVLRNITVTWNSDRPGLLSKTSTTDHNGLAVIRFQPEKGPWMGPVQITGTYGLAQVVYAPKVLVDCEELSLGFALMNLDPDEPYLAGGVASFPVRVRLEDGHGNPGVGRTVTFSGMKGIAADPLSVVTDQEGYASTNVTSIEPVEDAILLANYSTKDTLVINNITFVDNPSVRLLEVVSMAVQGQPLVLRCHVVGLGKLPSPDVEVTFYSDSGEAPIGTDITDDNGIAELTVAAPVAGKQTYIAKLVMHEQRLEVDVASAAVIHGESAEYSYPAAGAGTPTLLWVEVREEAHNQSRLIPNCPIWWSVAGPETTEQVSYPTDASGRSTFPFVASTVGKYVVTADRKGTPEDKRSFEVEVVPAIDWVCRLTDITTKAVGTHRADTEGLKLVRGHKYRFEIDLPDSVNLKKARAMLDWESQLSAEAMGMIFDPREGAYVEILEQKTLSWEIDCADLRNGAFRLTFYCDRLNQRLVLPGRLDAPPPALLYPAEGNKVEDQPMLNGTGSPSSQIFVFEGKNGPQLARTSVSKEARTWSVRTDKRLSPGPHVFSVKELHIDGTETWAKDVHITVDSNFVAPVIIQSPASGSSVRVGTWIEGLGKPGVEVRIVKSGDATTIYAQGLVGEDGRWRVRFGAGFGPDTYACGAAFYINNVQKSAWIPAFTLTFIPRTSA